VVSLSLKEWAQPQESPSPDRNNPNNNSTASSLTGNDINSATSSGLSSGAIIGIAVFGFVGLVAIIAAIVIYIKSNASGAASTANYRIYDPE